MNPHPERTQQRPAQTRGEAVIVVPCYNEAERWDAEYWRSLESLHYVRWYFVDDGSTDATSQCAAATSVTLRSTLLQLGRNRGKAEAVRVGLLTALDEHPTARYVGFMDADGAFAPADIERLMATASGLEASVRSVDAVWSSRVALSGRHIRRKPLRHYLGRLVATYLFWGLEDMPYDSQSGLKLFRSSERLGAILRSPFRTRWLFEVEMMARWRSTHGTPMRIWEMPVSSWRDVAGTRIRGLELARLAREVTLVRRLLREALEPRARAGRS